MSYDTCRVKSHFLPFGAPVSQSISSQLDSGSVAPSAL